MSPYLINIIETVLVVLIYLIFKRIVNKSTQKSALKFSKSESTVKIIKKIIDFLALLISGILIIVIWGVKQSDLVLFITSILTVLGIAFFAQWSIISNITAAFIIFFNHPAKIGDRIEIYDKDYPIKGKINDVGIFFVTVITDEGGRLSVPSNIFIQKMVIKMEE